MKAVFHLYSDIKKNSTGSAFYLIQNDKSKLKAYASKRMSGATRKYSIIELELCGLTRI